MSETQDFSRWGKQFQENLCNLILDDSAFAAQIGEVLDIKFLELSYLRLFTQKIYDYRTKYGVHPSRDSMMTMLRADIADLKTMIDEAK